jgi:hypothetical protein
MFQKNYASLLQPAADEVYLVHSPPARPAPCAAASLFRCAGTIDDDADSLQASEEERVWAEDTLDRYEARCRAAGLAAVRRVG